MYRLEYLPSADRDMEEAENYLSEFSPAAADELAQAFKKQMESLLEFPLLHPVSKYDETLRCMLLPYRYLCFYHVDEDAKLIRVYRVLRGMRDIPNIL